MANNLNLCQFIGNLGDDPETRYMPDGTPVTNIRIACNWKSKEREGVEWIAIVAFGKLSEIMGQYLRKGSKVYVSGRMRTRKWQDQSGADRWTTEIVADRMEMLDTRQGDGGQRAQSQYEGYAQSSGSRGHTTRDGAAQQRSQQAPAQEPAGFDGFDDDIPF
jgi:single-strand DNA-binding protein